MRDIGTHTIETDRLILRRFVISDAEGMYYGWASEEKVTRYISWKAHKDINFTHSILEKWINLYDDNIYNWVVEIKETHELIGNISAIEVNKIHNYCEIGYCYGTRYWGQGYATEALKAVIDYMFNECEMHVVEAKHRSDNPASGRVMQKAGMKQEAVLKERRYDSKTNTYSDLVCYSIIR